VTYIVGIKNNDVSAIISDSRVTFDNKFSEGRNYALKSGLLFRGCCYAAVGNANKMRTFVTAFKKTLSTNANASENWDQFISFFRSYDFSRSGHFGDWGRAMTTS